MYTITKEVIHLGRKNITRGKNKQLTDFSHLITNVEESSKVKVEESSEVKVEENKVKEE